MSIIEEIKNELEKPRHSRPLGSGWLSGSGSILAGLAGLLIVMVRFFPQTFTMPELAMIHESGYVTVFLRVVLLLGYVFALISILLSRNKVLGWTGLLISLVASLLGSMPATAVGQETQALYFGLDYFIVNVLFIGFLFVPLERFLPYKKEQTVFRPEWQEDMFYYLVSSMLVQILSFLTMGPSILVNEIVDMSGVIATIVALPFWVQVVVIMVATDFVQYWVHRAFHTFPFLWRFHSIHHSTQSMDWLAGARMHFLEIAVLRGLTAVPIFTLGFKPEAIQVYLMIVYFYSSFIHSNLGVNFSLIERFLVTPRFHHWHHGSERAAIDINYATHFPLLDWLFGTHHLPKGAWPKKYGVAGGGVPKGYFKQMVHPFKKPEK